MILEFLLLFETLIDEMNLEKNGKKVGNLPGCTSPASIDTIAEETAGKSECFVQAVGAVTIVLKDPSETSLVF